MLLPASNTIATHTSLPIMSSFTRPLALLILIMITTIMTLSIISFTLIYERRSRGLCKIFGLNEVEVRKAQAKIIKMLRPEHAEVRISYDEWEKKEYEKSLVIEGKDEGKSGNLVGDKVKEKARVIQMQRSATSAKLMSMARGVLEAEERKGI